MYSDFLQLKNSWKQFGSTEPFWSVLTNEIFKSNNFTENNKEYFFQSGQNEVAKLEKILNEHQTTFKNKVCLDFGCGVGRLTKHLVPLCSEIYGFDISEQHLKIAKENAPGAKFYLVENFDKFPKIDYRPDIIFSVMALQHNRPELIKNYTKLLLEMLNSEGLALLHIPYSIENYVAYNDNLNRMEMHGLSKKEFISLVKEHSCSVESIIETKYCGNTISDCIYVIRKKNT
jgi:cyclopropane fatty-acyl-phospholipid synthase-like methyltransferase